MVGSGHRLVIFIVLRESVSFLMYVHTVHSCPSQVTSTEILFSKAQIFNFGKRFSTCIRAWIIVARGFKCYNRIVIMFSFQVFCNNPVFDFVLFKIQFI